MRAATGGRVPLRHAPQLLTIIRNELALGRTWTQPPPVPEGSVNRLPGMLGMPDLKVYLEAKIIIDLVGSIAALMVPCDGYFGADPAEQRAEQAAETLAHVSPRHREQIGA